MTANDKSLASRASLSGTARGYNGTQGLAVITANDCQALPRPLARPAIVAGARKPNAPLPTGAALVAAVT